MQFLIYATDPAPEAAAPPTPELMAELGKLMEDSTQAGVMVTTGGLDGKSTRVRLSGGKYTVTDGPYVEAKELMGGFAVLEVKSLEEAVAWTKRFRDIIGEGTSEIVKINGPSDWPPA